VEQQTGGEEKARPANCGQQPDKEGGLVLARRLGRVDNIYLRMSSLDELGASAKQKVLKVSRIRRSAPEA